MVGDKVGYIVGYVVGYIYIDIICFNVVGQYSTNIVIMILWIDYGRISCGISWEAVR